MLEASTFEKITFFKIFNKDVSQSETSGDLIATPSVCLYIVLLKLNSTEEVALFINSTNASFEMTDYESD